MYEYKFIDYLHKKSISFYALLKRSGLSDIIMLFL